MVCRFSEKKTAFCPRIFPNGPPAQNYVIKFSDLWTMLTLVRWHGKNSCPHSSLHPTNIITAAWFYRSLFNFMPTIFCVITSSPPKMKMVFIHQEVLSFLESRTPSDHGTVRLCAAAASLTHLFELSLPSGTAAQSGSSVSHSWHSKFSLLTTCSLKAEVCIWHINLENNQWLVSHSLSYIRFISGFVIVSSAR